jgi:signal transduction histidine kinase
MSYPRHEPRPLPSYSPPGHANSASSGRPPSPPLTKRMRLWHWMAIDYVVGAVAALSAMLISTQAASAAAIVDLPAHLVLAGVIFFSVGLRRRHPVPAFCALITTGVVATAAGPADMPLTFLAAAYVLYMVTVAGSRQTGVAALALALGVILVTVVLARTHQIPVDRGGGVHVVVVFSLIIAWMTGHSVRQRRLYAQTMQHQAASSAVAEERLRIARELHDVVAHSMSVIAVQAGYGQYVIDSRPGDAREALGAIQATSRDALEEMRRMLGVLRQQDTASGAGRANRAPLAPAPGLADLDRLIRRTRGAGVQVSLERSGQVRAVPAGVDLSAYRIIQEALTNVVKHAGGGACCTVSLSYGEKVLNVRVSDDGGLSLSLVLTPAGVPPTAGVGHGIIGMRERANLCGGMFSAGPLPDGGFQVTATLPLLGGPAPAGGSASPADASPLSGAPAPDGSHDGMPYDDTP